MNTVRTYVPKQLDSKRSDIRLLRSQSGAGPTSELLYKNLPHDFDISWLQPVSTLKEADFVLLPQSIRSTGDKLQGYLKNICVEASADHKAVVGFIGTDLAYRLHVKGIWAFTASAYGHTMQKNEIMMVPYVEDLSVGKEISIRKKSAKPIIGFCGYAGFPNTKTKVRYLVKNLLLDALAFVTRNPHHLVYKRGIYFRRKAMEILSRDARVQTNFIVRDSFGGNVTTTKVDPARAREEYIQNMLDSDFVLAPKGDGNYSARFYEALSLGRIPILIDTDMVLPLENSLDYSKCILRVPHTEVHRLGEIVHDFYTTLTDESFAEMQRAARNAFAEHLRYDRFFAEVLPTLKGKMPPASL